MATTTGLDNSGGLVEKDVETNDSIRVPTSEATAEQVEARARVDAAWEKMNKGVSNKTLHDLLKKKKPTSAAKKTSHKSSANWMTYLGLDAKGTASPRRQQEVPKKEPSANLAHNTCSDEAKRLAAAALSAVKDATAASALGRGKVEIMEVRDFAGQDIEVKKLVDADSKEALEKTKVSAPSAVDALLEQIKKKQKLSVLDKTKKDWGEFKDDNKGMEEELDAYKKSSNQYLDKVSFLQRTDFREFERERDARLALQSKRRPDSLHEDP